MSGLNRGIFVICLFEAFVLAPGTPVHRGHGGHERDCEAVRDRSGKALMMYLEFGIRVL